MDGTTDACLYKFIPHFTTVIYSTQVNIIGNHLSGLLVIKTMPDSSIRIVFTSEMGLSFFDFEFSSNGDFKAHYIIERMNRKAVIRTLRQDFELVLMRGLKEQEATIFKNIDRIYYAFPQEKGSNYYITDPSCTELFGIEKASKRKAIVKVVMTDYRDRVPDTIGIMHTNFQFSIGLKRLRR
jgi:hypothetical protein